MKDNTTKTAYDALLKFSWNEQIPEYTLRKDTEALLIQYGANLNKCDIYINYDRDRSYVKIMPSGSMDDFSVEELDVYGIIADAIDNRLS